MGEGKIKSSRIPYLDGLRAFSIILVIFGHTFGPGTFLYDNPVTKACLVNSALGVHVFFVISGFLITTLLLNERESSGQISIRGFYERRVARIFPAFYLYIATILLLVALHVMTVPRSSFYAAATFTVNFGKLWHMGAGGEANPVFGHFWTLSIEEQFYLVWPSVLVFLGNRWSRRLTVAAVALFPLLRMALYFELHRSASASFLPLLVLNRTVQDVIMWGVLGAFLVRDGLLDRMRMHRFRWSYPWISCITIFGVGGMMKRYPILGLDSSLLPALQGAATLLFLFWLLSGKGGWLRRLLETWPVVQLGLLSYSLYIWQQIFLQWKGFGWLHFPWNGLLSLLAAVISYYAVESPLRGQIRRWFSQPQPAH